MKRTRQIKIPLETQLGQLAMQFRGARDDAERAAVTECYARIVKQLIRSGEWKEMPTFEDMLPDEWMPEAFFEFWAIPSPPGRAREEHSPLTIRVPYPLFLLMDGKAPVLVERKEGKARVPALAVFTDPVAAEHYRDEYVPNGKVASLPDEESFARALKLVRERIALVAFDPDRAARRVKTIPVDEMLRQLPHAP
jgi:hypothetical protein